MTRAEPAHTEVRCAECSRLVALVRPDGALEVRVRHGGQKHTTVVWGAETAGRSGGRSSERRLTDGLVVGKVSIG